MSDSKRQMQIILRSHTARVPAVILHSLQLHVEEIARALAQIDRGSPFWGSMRESGLSLEVSGWKFEFSVEPDALVLVYAQPVPPKTP